MKTFEAQFEHGAAATVFTATRWFSITSLSNRWTMWSAMRFCVLDSTSSTQETRSFTKCLWHALTLKGKWNIHGTLVIFFDECPFPLLLPLSENEQHLFSLLLMPPFGCLQYEWVLDDWWIMLLLALLSLHDFHSWPFSVGHLDYHALVWKPLCYSRRGITILSPVYKLLTSARFFLNVLYN